MIPVQLKSELVDAVRLAVGTIEGKKSSTWRIWANKKGDIYVAARSLGNVFKVSLHRDGNCHSGFTSEFNTKSTMAGSQNRSRHLDKWKLDLNSPSAALQILFLESELRSYTPNNIQKTSWFDPPTKNHMFVATIYTLPPYTKEVSLDLDKVFFPIASFESPIRNAIIVGHYQIIDLDTNSWIEGEKSRLTNYFNIVKSEGIRAILAGNDNKNGRRWLFDIAWQDEEN